MNVHKMLKVKNMTSERSGREVANQFVISYGGDVVMFQSYDSPIVEVDYSDGKITVFQDWDYSKTTAKYRNQFMRDYVGIMEMADRKGFERCMNEGRCGRFEVVRN